MSEPDPWQRVAGAIHELWEFRSFLMRDYPGTVKRLQREFQSGGQRMLALYILRFLEDEYTFAVIDEVIRSYLGEGSRLEAFETLVRLPRTNLEHHLPPAVWRLLDEERGNDEKDWLASDYETFAYLFDDLGLGGALAELVQRAQASDDPTVIRAGERVGQELLPEPGELSGVVPSPAARPETEVVGPDDTGDGQ